MESFHRLHLALGAPIRVEATRFVQQLPTGVKQPLFQVKEPGALSNERAVPRTLAPFDFAHCEVVGACRGIEVVLGPRALGLDQQSQVTEVGWCVGGALLPPALQVIEFCDQRGALLLWRCANAPRKCQYVEQPGMCGRVEAFCAFQMPIGLFGVMQQSGIVSEQGRGQSAGHMLQRCREGVANPFVDPERNIAWRFRKLGDAGGRALKLDGQPSLEDVAIASMLVAGTRGDGDGGFDLVNRTAEERGAVEQ